MSRSPRSSGLTLIELLIGTLLIIVIAVALFGVFTSTATLNEHSRNRAWAMTDATRIMEQLRQQNTGVACATPSAAPPAGFAATGWNGWLADTGATGAGGKTLQPDPTANELVTVSSSGVDPLTVTVSICWRSRSRVYGECQWTGSQLIAADANGDGIITAPAMIATLVTCRQ